jgi:hypothetical protein
MSIPDFRSPSIPARDIGSTVFYAIVERLTRLPDTSCPAANPLPRGSVPGVLTRPQQSARKKRSPIATRAVPTVRNGFTPTITPQKKQRPGERPGALDDPARRVACRRAHGATGGATQEGRLQGRAAPFRGRTAPEAGEVVAAPRRASAHRSAAARRGAAPAAPGRRPRALATGAGASERAAAAVAPVARAGQRAPSPADGSRGLGLGRRRFRGAAGARRGAGGAIRGDAGAAGLPGPLPNAAPAPAPARAPDIAHIVKMRGLRSARAAAFLQRKDLAPEPGVLTIDRTRYIHEWGRRWSATALKGE